MIVLSDRSEFIGAHLTKQAKEALKVEAKRQQKSMSEFISDAIEKELQASGALPQVAAK